MLQACCDMLTITNSRIERKMKKANEVRQRFLGFSWIFQVLNRTFQVELDDAGCQPILYRYEAFKGCHCQCKSSSW